MTPFHRFMKAKKNPVYDLPHLLLTLAVLLWSGNFILGRAVRMDVPPIALAFWRWAGASLLIWCPAVPFLKKDWQNAKDHWPILLLLSASGVAAFNTLVYTGLQSTIAINAFLMQALMPVLIVAMSFLVFREKITLVQAAGIAFSMAGAFTIILKGDWNILHSLNLNRGDILVFVAVVCYAGYSVLLRKRPAMHPLSFVAVTFVAGTLMLIPFYVWETLWVRPISFDRTAVLSIAYVAIFPSIVSYLCFNRGVELVGANQAGLFMYLMPVFGSIMAIFLLGESFRWFHIAGIILIATGIFLATRKPA